MRRREASINDVAIAERERKFFWPAPGPRPVVRLGVYVAATPEFTEHPKVADAASELLRDIFGEEAVFSRLVFGITSRPLGSPVELEVILEVKP